MTITFYFYFRVLYMCDFQSGTFSNSDEYEMGSQHHLYIFSDHILIMMRISYATSTTVYQKIHLYEFEEE